MKAKKVAVICLTLAMTIGMLGGCGSSEKSEGETTGEQITLNYWTWFPSKDQIQETVDAFEKENPNIKINMTVMESKAFQEKADHLYTVLIFPHLPSGCFPDTLLAGHRDQDNL